MHATKAKDLSAGSQLGQKLWKCHRRLEISLKRRLKLHTSLA
jgi:hypothetical protein